MSFSITLTTVVIMLLYAVPGYIMMKTRLFKPDAIGPMVTLLIYLCSPFQVFYAMQQVNYSPRMARELGVCALISIALMGTMLGVVYFALRGKQQIVPYRICTAASACGNVGFIAIPLLEALLPQYPQAVAFSSVFSTTMNLLMWTVCSYIITRDRRYMSLRKLLLNPVSIGMALAIVLFFARVQLQGQLGDMVALIGRMATPLCMLILGMRMALIPIRPMFTRPIQYLAIALKMIAFPLLALLVCSLLPLEKDFVRSVYIICCTPVGSVVLSFSEMLGEGQDTAANVMLLSTLMSLILIPLMMLLA